MDQPGALRLLRAASALSDTLDKASRGPTESDDQIGLPLTIERPEIFNKFGVRRLIAAPSRDDGMFLNVERPTRLFDQFFADFPAPCGPRLETLAIRIKKQDFFRLSGSLARPVLSGSLAN